MRLVPRIRASFDANAAEKSDDFNVVLASDVLAEGINLHRANVIVNYDTPWNATRLMQRIGRVNRIGSVAEAIHSYMFHPSKQGNRAIGLYQNSVIKLQGFHSALGEDAQVFSHEEMLRTFTLFNADVKDAVDESLRYLRIVRKFRKGDPAAYDRIRSLPMKCRSLRKSPDGFGGTVAYIASESGRRAGFVVKDGAVTEIGNVDLMRRLEAKAEEQTIDWSGEAQERNYGDVSAAMFAYENPPKETVEALAPSTASKSKVVATARHFLRDCARWVQKGCLDARLESVIERIGTTIAVGKFAHLDRAVSKMSKAYKSVFEPDDAQRAEIAAKLDELHAKYCKVSEPKHPDGSSSATATPELIVSETFA